MTKPLPPLTDAEIAAIARKFDMTEDYYRADLATLGPRKRIRYSRGARFILATLHLKASERKALPKEEQRRLIRAAEDRARPTPDAEEASRCARICPLP